MARICARCRQPLDRGREADHDCPEDDDLEPETGGDESDEDAAQGPGLRVSR